MRSKAELAAIKQMLTQRHAAISPVTEAITQRAIVLMEAPTLSYGLQLGDALIAATALEHGLPVLTINTRHFEPVEGLAIEAFRV